MILRSLSHNLNAEMHIAKIIRGTFYTVRGLPVMVMSGCGEKTAQRLLPVIPERRLSSVKKQITHMTLRIMTRLSGKRVFVWVRKCIHVV